MVNILTKRAFNKIKSDFYMDASDAIKSKESFSTFLKKEADRERLYGSKRLSNLYLSWVAKLSSSTHKGGVSGTMSDFVSNQEATILSAFEESGKLSDGFLVASDAVDKVNKIRSVYVNKLSYPAFSLLIALNAASFIYDVFPKNFGAKTPFIGKIVIAYTGFVSQNMSTMMIILFALIVLVSWSLPNVKGDFRLRILDKYIMPYTTYKTFRASSFLIILSALLKAGMSLDKALTISISKSGNWMGEYLLLAKMKLSNIKLKHPVESLNVGLLDNRTYFRLESASQKSSGLDGALVNLAERGFERILSQAGTNAAFMGQIIMALAGGSVVLMMAGLIQTMFSVTKI